MAFFFTLILDTRVHIHSADISRNPTTSSISIKLLISAPPCLEMRLSSRQRDDLADVGLPCQSEPTRWTRPIERLCSKSQAGRIDVINNDGWHISISSHCTKNDILGQHPKAGISPDISRLYNCSHKNCKHGKDRSRAGATLLTSFGGHVVGWWPVDEVPAQVLQDSLGALLWFHS